MTKVATGHHSLELVIFIDNRKSGETLALHDFANLRHRKLARNRKWLLNHGIFRSLHFCNHRGLLVDGAGPVNHRNAALTGQGHREFGFGNCIHRRGDHGDVKRNSVAEFGANIGFRREQFAQTGR